MKFSLRGRVQLFSEISTRRRIKIQLMVFSICLKNRMKPLWKPSLKSKIGRRTWMQRNFLSFWKRELVIRQSEIALPLCISLFVEPFLIFPKTANSLRNWRNCLKILNSRLILQLLNLPLWKMSFELSWNRYLVEFLLLRTLHLLRSLFQCSRCLIFILISALIKIKIKLNIPSNTLIFNTNL